MIKADEIRKGMPITWTDIINGKAATLDGYIVSVNSDISFGFRVRGRERVSGAEYETMLYPDDRSITLQGESLFLRFSLDTYNKAFYGVIKRR